MNYLLLGVSVIAASLNSVFLHKLDEKRDVFEFNMFTSLVWIVILFMANGFKIAVSPAILGFAALYGGVQVLFQLSKSLAMSSGPVSVTTLIGNCSLLLSTAVGVLVWRESVSAFQAFGLALLIVSVLLCGYTKSNTAGSVKWRLYCAAFFVFAAGIGIVFKVFSKTGDTSRTGDMMLLASIVMAASLAVITLIRRKKSGVERPKTSKGYVFLILVCGVLSCLYNRLNITLTGEIPSIIFFPCFNGGVILISFLISRFMLSERLKMRQTVGILLGTSAVCIVGLL